LLSKLRQAVSRALEGHARLAYRLGLRPNHVSALGLLWASLAALAYWRWRLLWPYVALSAPLLVLLSGYSDVLDGLIARLHGLASRSGAMLDSMLDRYADVAIILGLWAGGLCGPLEALLACAGSLLVSYARARAESLGAELAGVGLAERAERLIMIIAASWLELFWPGALRLAVLLLAALTHITAIHRLARAYSLLRAGAPGPGAGAGPPGAQGTRS